MEDSNSNFNLDNIQSVELNLLNGQIEIILRSLELYGYNLEYMLNTTEATEDIRQEKMALIKYTYEQVLASQAEQVNGKSNTTNNLPSLGKNMLQTSNIIDIIPKERNFKAL